MSEYPDSLYHYCPLNAAVSILREKTVRMSSIFHLNDRLEHRWLCQVAIDVFKREFAHNYTQQDAEKIVANLNDPEMKPIYCACFSKNPDSLPQWRAYADIGFGVALGFDCVALKRFLDSGAFNYGPESECVEIRPVIYKPDEQRKIVDSLFQLTKYLNMDDNRSKPLSDGAITSTRDDIGIEASRCKHPSFETEEEWRLTYEPTKRTGTPDMIGALDVAVVGRTLVPFYPFNFHFNKSAPPPIHKVVLGPQVGLATEHTLKLLLQSLGYQAEVIRSTSSLCTPA